MEKCPVCGMDVDSKTAPAKTSYEGRTYFFCSNQCKEQFEMDPQRYVDERVR
jgi:YHS domain-containing protein